MLDTHLMGEANEAKKTALAQATPHGQLVFFAEFLATAGVFERWVEGCPPIVWATITSSLACASAVLFALLDSPIG